MKSVSIIINSYNYGRFLRATIESALNQTYHETEVIVVDDGSSDDSVEIIESYGDQIISVIKNNGGQASALNAGFKRSSNDVVIFLDSDDVLFPEAACSAAVAFLDEELVKVDWPLKIIDATGRWTGEVLPIQPYPNKSLKQLTIDSGPFYDWHITCPTSGNAWSRNFLEKVLPIPEDIYITCADEYLLALSPIFGTIKRLKDPLTCYRSHGNNNGWKKEFSDQKIDSDLRRFEFSCSILKKFCRSLSIEVDPDRWHQENWNYQWMKKVKKAKEDLLQLIPPGECYILIDNYDMGTGLLSDRRELSFHENGNTFFGSPEDSAAAIFQLEAVRQFNARYLVFWWTCFWWLDYYQEFKEYLSKFDIVLNNDRLLAFDISNEKK